MMYWYPVQADTGHNGVFIISVFSFLLNEAVQERARFDSTCQGKHTHKKENKTDLNCHI